MTCFIISALGSYGDLHPMVGIGSELRRRGHDVAIVANPYFADVVERAGLELAAVGSREDYVELSQHPHLWHPILGPRLVLGLVGRELRKIYDTVVARYVAGETVFCAHGLDMASRVAAKKFGAPLAAIHFAPGMFWSLDDSPRLKGALTGPGVPRWIKRMQFWVSDSVFAYPLVGKPVNRLRRELGLRPIDNVFRSWIHEADVVIGMFPDWFGRAQRDWPANVHLAGFPLWDGGDAEELTGEVREFLARGEAPIAFSPGSANREAHQFFAAAVEACERLGRRGVLLTKYDHQLPARLPNSVGHFGFVPLGKLLPHACALVHHGGIGNCAQGLAAGLPQLVRPMSFDQFDNSRRLVELGVGEEISVRKFRGEAIAKALARLMASSVVAERCRELAPRCDGPTAIASACDRLERLAMEPAAR